MLLRLLNVSFGHNYYKKIFRELQNNVFMLPHYHFLITVIILLPFIVLFYPELSYTEIVYWIIIGGLISIIIDFDVIFMTYIKSDKEEKLKQFKKPQNLFKNFKQFMDIITELGILKKVMITHIISSMIIILLFYFFINHYFVLSSIAVITHILTDIPNIKRII